MDQRDVNALNRCLRLYRARGSKEASEITALVARHGLQYARHHACIRMQAINLGLDQFALTPSEFPPTSPEHMQGDVNERRGEMIAIVKQLDAFGLSRYTPDPRAAITAAEHLADLNDFLIEAKLSRYSRRLRASLAVKLKLTPSTKIDRNVSRDGDRPLEVAGLGYSEQLTREPDEVAAPNENGVRSFGALRQQMFRQQDDGFNLSTVDKLTTPEPPGD